MVVVCMATCEFDIPRTPFVPTCPHLSPDTPYIPQSPYCIRASQKKSPQGPQAASRITQRLGGSRFALNGSEKPLPATSQSKSATIPQEIFRAPGKSLCRRPALALCRSLGRRGGSELHRLQVLGVHGLGDLTEP